MGRGDVSLPIYQAVILGIVQGLAEFLPISSSAHLTLVPWALGWEDPGQAFDVALHWGTLVAVIGFFGRDWIRLIDAALRGLKRGQFFPDDDPNAKLFWLLVVASVPGALFGFWLNKKAEEGIRSPMVIAGALALMGLVLLFADRTGAKTRPLDSLSITDAIQVGLGQALALIPGVSRSGVTISVGLFRGLDRESIARFSFLMSTPIIFGAGVVKLPHLVKAMLHGAPAGEVQVGPVALAAGMLVAAIVGYGSIRWMLAFLKHGSYAVFATYRVAAALGTIALYVARGL